MDLRIWLEELRDACRGVHMPHVYYGDPTVDFSEKLVWALAGSGADLLEFGVPFSDPTADGPAFIASCERALENGVTPKTCLDAVKRFRLCGFGLPVVVTSYYNILYVAGVRRFLEEIKDVGGQGIIVPDLPIEEAGELLDAAKSTGVYPVLQVTPNTSVERLRWICDASSGFIYVINVEGVTGVRNSVHGSTLKLVKTVKSLTDTPILAGFGVSSPEHAGLLVEAGADGVIAGSVYAGVYEKQLDDPERSLPVISRLAYEIKRACDAGVYRRNG